MAHMKRIPMPHEALLASTIVNLRSVEVYESASLIVLLVLVIAQCLNFCVLKSKLEGRVWRSELLSVEEFEIIGEERFRRRHVWKSYMR